MTLDYNLRTHTAAPEATTAYVMSDDSFVYVAFEANQRAPIRVSQYTNNVGCCVDDSVQIDLWPNGPSGFRYLFIATPIGTRYQYSSENNVYEPDWSAVGKLVPGGYVVTMKIPLAVMHGTGSGAWRVQFARVVQATNDDIVWSYGPPQQNHNDVNYAAPAQGLPLLAAHRPKPRAGVYTLGQAGSSFAGGVKARGGADISFPVLPGTSLVAAIHPDFSDVEVDQQSIAPTAFVRQVNEVRPFFTQGANFYNTTPYCPQCPGSQLYTPGIPTPQNGFALEGQRGLFSYAAFDALGTDRDDTAQVLNYTSPNQENRLTAQRGSTSMPNLNDVTLGASYTHDNLKNFAQWIRYGTDSGTNVLAGDRAQRYEAGASAYTPTSALSVTLRKIGAYYNPVDGYVNNPDIAGYDVAANKTWRLSGTSSFKEFDLSGNLDRYHGYRDGLSQSDQYLLAQATTKNNWSIAASTGSSYLRLNDGVFSPVTGSQGVAVYYNYGAATQSFVQFETGRFGPGRLNSWTRVAALRLGARGTLGLDLDNTQQGTLSTTYSQWLERVSFNLQSGPDESFGVGVRRIIGTPPMLDTVPQFQNGSNIAISYHRKMSAGELYAVYGDAAAFSTVPAFLVKFIRYVGGQKGT